MLKIYFCFPFRGVGGVSLLFLRMAEHIASAGMAECHIVDYVDGFMAKNRKVQSVKLEIYEDEGLVVDIPPDAIAVLQSMTPWSIFPSLCFAESSRVLFWNCYPFNLVPLLPGVRRYMQHSLLLGKLILATLLRSYRNRMRRLVEVMQAKHALVFMDNTNVVTTEQYLSMSIQNPEFLPIAAVKPKSTPHRVAWDIPANGLRFVWIGRVVNFKYHTLLRCLIDLNALQSSLGFPVGVTVVGSGDYLDILQRNTAMMSNLKVEFVEHINPDFLDDFLLEQADILLAMGTSALEGAKLGIPTILLDVAHAPVPDGYIYKWLHQRCGYTLGDVLGDSHLQLGNNSLASCLDEFIGNYDEVASNSRKYFEKNHEISVVASQFMKYIETVTCTYGELVKAGLMARSGLYRIFTQLRKGVARL